MYEIWNVREAANRSGPGFARGSCDLYASTEDISEREVGHASRLRRFPLHHRAFGMFVELRSQPGKVERARCRCTREERCEADGDSGNIQQGLQELDALRLSLADIVVGLEGFEVMRHPRRRLLISTDGHLQHERCGVSEG